MAYRKLGLTPARVTAYASIILSSLDKFVRLYFGSYNVLCQPRVHCVTMSAIDVHVDLYVLLFYIAVCNLVTTNEYLFRINDAALLAWPQRRTHRLTTEPWVRVILTTRIVDATAIRLHPPNRLAAPIPAITPGSIHSHWVPAGVAVPVTSCQMYSMPTPMARPYRLPDTLDTTSARFYRLVRFVFRCSIFNEAILIIHTLKFYVD